MDTVSPNFNKIISMNFACGLQKQKEGDIIRRRQGLRQIRLAATEDPGKLLSPIGWAGGARSQVAAGKKVLGLYLL
jgi:hypothetical protein